MHELPHKKCYRRKKEQFLWGSYRGVLLNPKSVQSGLVVDSTAEFRFKAVSATNDNAGTLPGKQPPVLFMIDLRSR